MTLWKVMAEGVMQMDEHVWRRHASPWSVYTRYSGFPLLVFAIWSRAWIGWWALVPIVIVVIWIWLNPRVFPVPGSFDNWASKSVLGERVWLNRKAVPIPSSHAFMLKLLPVLIGLPSLAMIYGLVVYDLSATIWGLAGTIVAKTWFLDRMVWLYEDMARQHAPYASWLEPQAPSSADAPAR